jgi:hypothetical protein
MSVASSRIPHLPILRKGKPYKSLDVAKAVHYQTREPIAEVSQANLGLIRRDLLDQAGPRAALAAIPYAELVAMAKRAAEHFLKDPLPLDPFAGIDQSPDDYVRQLSATTGMPHVLVRRNMLKVHGVLAQVEEMLGGLTRGLDLSLLDTGIGTVAGRAVSFFPRGDAMGVVLPNNSPGVHSLWAPTTVLKIPLVLKPGSAEPWTPYRMIQAWLKAGCPPEAFSFYPCDHAGGNEILRRTGRGVVFGDVKATERWRKEGGRVEIHGPGHSKVILGADALANWEQHLDTIAASVADNGGRSCVNASGVWVTGKGREIAEALARKLSTIVPRAADDEAAGLAPFVDPSVAERVSALIDKDLEIQPGVEDVSAKVRGTGRVAKVDGSTYLLPTVLLADREHPLANREYMFPFVSVVEVPEDELPDCLGHSLVVTAITENPALIDRLVASPIVDRLNIGSLPTTRIGWDQPHEGNLFEHLYARRAIQRVA